MCTEIVTSFIGGFQYSKFYTYIYLEEKHKYRSYLHTNPKLD